MTSEEWARGFEWGIRFYVTNRDPGLTFKIKLDIKNTSSSPVGPNKVLPDQGSPKAPAAPPAAPPSKAPMSPPRGHNSSTGSPVTSAPSTLSTLIHTVPPITRHPSTGDRLFNLIRGAYQALNQSNPNDTESCWLCLTASPPYYEGIVLEGSYSHSSSHGECAWQDQGATATPPHMVNVLGRTRAK